MTLVERLREPMARDEFFKVADRLCKEAADRIESLEAEGKALRQIIHETASALPNGAFIAPSCSVEFMAGLPNEVKSVCSTLEAELEKAREAALEEAAAYIEGKGGKIPGANSFSALVSGNNQPCMSGDGRDRLHKHQRRAFDQATAALAAAIRSLSHKEG